MQKHNINISSVLVIGTGGAGLRSAIEAKTRGLDVTIIGKRLKEDAHTVLAAGGINAAFANVDKDDSWEQHFADTMIEGYRLSEPRTVEIMAKESPELVREIDKWGANFAKLDNGEIDQRFFGAHTYRRTCYSGDYTGRSILNALIKKTKELNIPIYDSQYVTEILVHEGVCFGVMAFETKSGERTVFLADSVILAAGGHTRIWRKSSSRRNENTGDGFLLALRAGCSLMDMELVQFHPTGMVIPEEMAGTLVTEAVRGEGGRLYNSLGERYMKEYDAERMELSTRDRVAIANYKEITEGRGSPNNGVYLDISHRSKEFIIEKLPRMYRQYLDTLMIDISEQAMEVSPTAHYSMGGILVDPDSHQTEVEGLFAAGEVTGGLHGANRLGGNSLAEILVFGKIAGEYAAGFSKDLDLQMRNRSIINDALKELDQLTSNGEQLARPLQRAVRNIMWNFCGVIRSGEGLEEGLTELMKVKEASKDVDVRPSAEGFSDLALALDLLGSIDSAEATIRSAIARKESRGAHQRSDYVEMDNSENVNYIVELVDGNQSISKTEVEKLPELLQDAMDAYEELSVEGRLLE